LPVRILRVLAFFLAISAALCAAQAPAPLSPAIDAKAHELLAKLTLEQKVLLIGGVEGMFTNAVPSINLPRLKMSDASVGVRTWGRLRPTRAAPRWRPPGTRTLRAGWARAWARTPAPAASSVPVWLWTQLHQVQLFEPEGASDGLIGVEVAVSFDVTNTGKCEGAEVAQLYVSDPSAKVKRPERELKGFEKVRLAAGETRHVTLSLDARAFSYWNESAHKWTIDPGKFVILVGDSSENTPLDAEVTLN
jgi:hypothetical protein